MSSPIFNFPVLEFCWYGLVSVVSLLCFASLSYEVRRALDATKKSANEDAAKVTWTTYNINFAMMVIANILLIVLCVGIAVAAADQSDWKSWFAASIFVCGAYWSYTRACEKKLILFLKQVGVYPQTSMSKFHFSFFKQT